MWTKGEIALAVIVSALIIVVIPVVAAVIWAHVIGHPDYWLPYSLFFILCAGAGFAVGSARGLR